MHGTEVLESAQASKEEWLVLVGLVNKGISKLI